MSTGEIIAMLRKEKNMTQKELGTYLNLSSGTISNYENNVHSIDMDVLSKLADLFGITTDYLLGRTSYRCPPELLEQYLIQDYIFSDITDAILRLDSAGRESVIDFIQYKLAKK